MVLQEFPKVLDDELRCACIAVFLETLVDPDDIDELVRQVIFTALAGFKCDGRPHRDRRDREDCQDHPFRTGICRIHADDSDVFIGDVLETVADLRRRQFFAVFEVFRGFLELDLFLFFGAVRAFLDFGCFLVDFVDQFIRHVAELFERFKLPEVFLLFFLSQEKTTAVPADGS